jgi:general L-amino acid transport system permease protein
MLLSDTRFRSYTIQVIALALVMLAVGWLLDNMFRNLAALGKDISFSFMTNPSSYDINQTLIAYTSRSSHATAAVVGILNTLLIAVLGCFAATVIGVIVGVLRLTKNWIVSRLMTVYIESLRNVPVLLQIIMWAAVFDETLPNPRQAEPVLGGALVATNRGFYLPAPVFAEGSAYVIGALVLGVAAAVWFAGYARRRQEQTGEILHSFWSGLGLIVLPTALAFFALGRPIGLEYPELKGFNFQGGIFARNSLVALWLALSVYTSAFIAENVRAGIMAISKGQTEAAFALGLRPGRTMRLIILPQALRVIIPPLISQYLNLTKNSSLAIAVGYMDATGTLGGITLNQTGREMECLLLLMGFYLTVSLAISAVMNLYNEQVKLVERTSATGFAFSFTHLFAHVTGEWENLKKGDAREHPAYGIGGWLNLVVLFYLVVLAGMLHFVFIDGQKASYWTWSLGHKIIALAMIAVYYAVLVTALFKHFRAVDLAVVSLILWVAAAASGFPLAEALPLADGTVTVVAGTAAQIAIIAYIIFGTRPNVTYLNRVRRAAG